MRPALVLTVVGNRGNPPASFIAQLLEWARNAAPAIFAPNDTPVDIFTVIKPFLATQAGCDGSGTPIYHWDSFAHRRAAMLEAMRVHAGWESSWNWSEGVDKTNAESLSDKRGQETGIFQVSFNSLRFMDSTFAMANGITGADDFIRLMKEKHGLALEYYALLVRQSVQWAGPLIRHGRDSIFPYLRRDAMREFEQLLT